MGSYAGPGAERRGTICAGSCSSRSAARTPACGAPRDPGEHQLDHALVMLILDQDLDFGWLVTPLATGA